MGPVKWSEFTDCIADPNKPANLKCLEAVFANIISLLVSFAGLALFGMFLVGGFTYLTAGDNAEKAGKARQTMFWAIMGIVFMILSYIILRLIAWFTGQPDLLEFRIPYFDPNPTSAPTP
jgi:hypothetical protein